MKGKTYVNVSFQRVLDQTERGEILGCSPLSSLQYYSATLDQSASITELVGSDVQQSLKVC